MFMKRQGVARCCTLMRIVLSGVNIVPKARRRRKAPVSLKFGDDIVLLDACQSVIGHSAIGVICTPLRTCMNKPERLPRRNRETTTRQSFRRRGRSNKKKWSSMYIYSTCRAVRKI